LKAEIVAIGTELLLGEIANTNAQYLSLKLAELGIDVYYHSTVGDNLVRIVDTLGRAAERADLVIVTGGLGPTEDDLTRQAVSMVSNCPLELSTKALGHLEQYFGQVCRPATKNNLRQAYFPTGSVLLDNPRGTALGFVLPTQRALFICLPGVPRELYVMFEQGLSYLRKRLEAEEQHVIESRVLKVCGIGESALEEQISDLVGLANPSVALYAKLGEVRIRITAKAGDKTQAQALIAPVENTVRQRLGTMVYGSGNDELEEVVGKMLLAKRQTLSIAESCTGGLVGHRLTNVSGSSGFLKASLVTYTNEAKNKLLGVPQEVLDQAGAVSEVTAKRMACGVRDLMQTDYGLAVTGIAGPLSDVSGKPVGLVYIAVVGERTIVEEHHFGGDREQIKYRSSQGALDLLRRQLLC